MAAPGSSEAAAGQDRAEEPSEVVYGALGSLQMLPQVIALVEKDLSEPYSVYTYRYFVVGWPELALVATNGETSLVGVIICKADRANRRQRLRGYIAMLAVESSFRKRGIGSELVRRAIAKMREMGCDEVVLETEYSNKTALAFYERQGFVRSKRMVRYYLNGGDAFRLKLWFTSPSWADPEVLPDPNAEAPLSALAPLVDQASEAPAPVSSPTTSGLNTKPSAEENGSKKSVTPDSEKKKNKNKRGGGGT